MKQKLLLSAIALWSAAALALPSTEAVQAAVKAGNYPQAESMMQEVVAAKPQSARAHYVYAEILAHDAKFDEAERQARLAREADPALGFTDPDKFRTFEKTLQREQAGASSITSGLGVGNGRQAATNAMRAPAPVTYERPAGGGVPRWVWGLGFAVIAFLIWRMVSRRAETVVMAPAGSYGSGGFPARGGGYGTAPMQPGYGPNYGPGYGAAPGGGLLRTGLAAAGGVAAGMLVEKMIEDHREEGYRGDRSGYLGGTQSDGFDNGSNQAASDLESRPIDFGSGNDWGDDASSGADFTLSDDDSGGGW